ncbi:PA domain-containing protein [Haloferax sp. YSMS24]|uniref:PA domain-containing protein n=1 Tax=Haloferax sp. YSMS24 TaxID=3388425 RepID=UPI00398CFBFC
MSTNNSNDKPESSSSPTRTSVSRRSILAMLGVGGLGTVGVLPRVASAHHPDAVTDDPTESDEHEGHRGLTGHGAPDPSEPLEEHDAAVSDVVSDGPSADVVKNLALAGRGERLLPNGTTDVWAHEGYAYVGTFNTPCGTGAGYVDGGEVSLQEDLLGPGIAVFDVHNPNKPEYVGSIPSVAGSRTNDVKVANMNSGQVLAHSNEACDGGPGGFELYNVDDPTAPMHLASVQTDDINGFLRDNFGYVDFGVHNLWFFTQGANDYIAAVVESEFGNFQIFDITDPSNPEFVSGWGAESLFDPNVDWASTTDFAQILEADAYLFGGFGSSQNRFLHDVTVNEEGTRAYLANWDAGLVLLDISDPANPTLVSQAIDPNAGDGEVNSHQAFPNEDGSVVVETEEDFDPFELTFEITSGANAGEYPVAEGAITEPIVDLPDGTMSGPTTYVGLGCEAGSVLPAPSPDHIAVIQRGDCTFTSKAQNALDAGYAGIVVFNDAARGDALVTMGGDPVDIPGVFVGHSTGLAILGVNDVSEVIPGASGAPVEVVSGYGRWGNVRIWDYSDESNPQLRSEFDTVCSANPGDPSCDPRGTYSVHNIIVEDDMVYISWYSDGVLILDISDPANPVEVARYSPSGQDFEDQNGGIQDVWGIDKEKNSPWIYASDRNGGLYVLKELGSGSENRNR